MVIAQCFVLDRIQFAVLGLLIIFAMRLYGNAKDRGKRVDETTSC